MKFASLLSESIVGIEILSSLSEHFLDVLLPSAHVQDCRSMTVTSSSRSQIKQRIKVFEWIEILTYP